MKTITAIVFLLSTLVIQDVQAQTRRPRYNPNPRDSRQQPSRPSTPRGPRYNPNPDRGNRPTPSSGGYNPSPSTPSTPRGPRYNPNPQPGTGTYRPAPAPVPRGPRYNPNPSGPVYRPGPIVYRPAPTYYGTPSYHRPYGYTPVRYVTYYHTPYTYTYSQTIRYYRTYDWYVYVYRTNPQYVYANWIFWPASGYTNGHWTIDYYPYYVWNGYRYRYSTTDYCNYQLVDSYDHRVTQTYWGQICNTGYDRCSIERDRLNAQMGDYRYFCSETWRDYDYDYSRPSYDETSYPTPGSENTDLCADDNYDGYCESDYGSETCTDYNSDGYCD